MKNILYILLLIGLTLNAQVNLSTYGAIGDGVTDDTAAIQAAFNAETNITSDPANTYLISGTLYLNQNMAQIIDFNNSTLISNTGFGSWFIDVDKRNYANTLTTIRNLDVNGNDQNVYGIDVASRVLFENIEIHNMIRDCSNGIRVLVYNTVGMYGQSVFDNVDIHDLVSATNDAVIGNCAGMVHAFLVSTSQLVTQTVQIVYKNSDIYNTWGEDAGGITINSPGIDTSNSPLSFWFENVTVSDAQRRTVKNFIGNTTWINCTFTSAAYTNPNLVKPPTGLNPAGLVSVGAESGATGATNNFFCGCTFEGDSVTPNDSWYVEVILIGSNGPSSMEIRNSTFPESGMNGRWAPSNGISAYGSQVQDLTIQNTTFATTKKIRALGTALGTFLLDSNNTYADGKTSTLENTTMAYTESAIPFEACPTILSGGTAVTGVKTYPNTDKLLVSGTRQLHAEIEPSLADDLTGAWSTSNGAVATVNSSTGLVTAVGVGSCTITFTATDTTNGTITDTTTITVESSTTEDSIMILQPQGYYTPTSGDADSWDDTSGFELHGTEVGVITFTDEASFDGASYYDLPNSQFLDYTPSTDSFTLIWREGDTSPTSSGYSISKQGNIGNLAQYGSAYSTGNFQSVYLGGELEGSPNLPEINPNRLFIVIVTPTTYNVWADGVNGIINSTAIGSATYSGSANIGGRTDGSYLLNSGATLDIVATIPKAISTEEREAIETEFQVNGAAVSASTKPTGALGEPVYWLNSVKKFLKGN